VIRNGETGILVPVDDHVALHRALERLLLDSDLRERMGAVGRAHAVETFSLSRLVDDLDRLYRELLATKTPTTR
jgi:glycosyltransferase involved in cell wall biosynthesis